MTDPKTYFVFVKLRAFDADTETIRTRIEECLGTHPTLSLKVDSVICEEDHVVTEVVGDAEVQQWAQQQWAAAEPGTVELAQWQLDVLQSPPAVPRSLRARVRSLLVDWKKWARHIWVSRLRRKIHRIVVVKKNADGSSISTKPLSPGSVQNLKWVFGPNDPRAQHTQHLGDGARGVIVIGANEDAAKPLTTDFTGFTRWAAPLKKKVNDAAPKG